MSSWRHRKREQEAWKQSEVRRYALDAARVEFERLLTLFPELRSESTPPVLDAHLAAVKHRTLKHWRKTATPKASTNGHGGPSLRALVRELLTTTPQTIDDLLPQIEARGYKHSGKTPFRTRVPQEARVLTNQGFALKTKRGWKLKGVA
jgi:hypothetical protein